MKEKIEITYEFSETPDPQGSWRVQVIAHNDDGTETLLFSEITPFCTRSKSGLGGAANLLYALAYGNRQDAYYINDEYLQKQLLIEEWQRSTNRLYYTSDIGKRVDFLGKLSLQLLNLKLKFLKIICK